MHQQVPCTRKKMISFGSRLIACCKLAPTLARQMWRHNYVIDRKEYLIFTLSESINPWVYPLQFLFKSTNNSWRYERKCEWVFFSEHSVSSYHMHWMTHRAGRPRRFNSRSESGSKSKSNHVQLSLLPSSGGRYIFSSHSFAIRLSLCIMFWSCSIPELMHRIIM